MGAVLFCVSMMIAWAAICVFAAIKLLGFLRRQEGWYRGVQISRREDPTRYWVTVGALVFVVGVSASVAGGFAFIVYGSLA